MTNVKNKFFLKTLPIMIIGSLFVLHNYANAAPRTAIRGSAGARQAVAQQITTDQTQSTTKTEAAKETTTATVEKAAPALNKSSQFDEVISASSTSASGEDADRAERIRQQREAFAANEAISTAKEKISGNANVCDTGLRKCMTDDKVCGKDFTKCATDGDTVFGDKLNKCRRDLKCTGEEFKLFTAEIKADRDMNVRLSSYNAVLNCGNEYNNCIINECGPMFDKCLGKAAADKATSNCKPIATRCKEQDSGLASRFGSVVGKLREKAEIDVKQDEERMYALRDLMRNTCKKMGAEFDERSFDCVYSIKFFAGSNQKTPMASRKAYAGDMFTCRQEWFGIDVTTFKENAYRETRSQTAASSAFLGAGVGTATGLIASGAMGRALDRQKAEKELKAAKKEQAEAGKQSDSSTSTNAENGTSGTDNKKADSGSNTYDTDAAPAGKKWVDGKTPGTRHLVDDNSSTNSVSSDSGDSGSSASSDTGGNTSSSE